MPEGVGIYDGGRGLVGGVGVRAFARAGEELTGLFDVPVGACDSVEPFGGEKAGGS